MMQQIVYFSNSSHPRHFNGNKMGSSEIRDKYHSCNIYWKWQVIIKYLWYKIRCYMYSTAIANA